jgi:hypothetical protein
MQDALQQMIAEFENLQRENPRPPEDSPRIVIPGRDF